MQIGIEGSDSSGRTAGSGPSFKGEVDLASRWLGASVVAASDESFGEKEHLLAPEPASATSGRYGPRGEIVDGWETRRRREGGHDWAVVRLGSAGVVSAVEVDTSYFTGNHPVTCMVEAAGCEGYPSPAELAATELAATAIEATELAATAIEWVTLVSRLPLRGDHRNVFPVDDDHRYTHVRLSIFPDGGVARLRVLGHVVPDPTELDGLTIDLASERYGGVVTTSDEFYSSARQLIRPDAARTMGEGWETRRRRDEGHDVVFFRLAAAGVIQRLEVDTAHFKYNATAEIEVSATDGAAMSGGGTGGGGTSGAAMSGAGESGRVPWVSLLGRTRLQPDTRHLFVVRPAPSVATIRLDAYPDGGISRVRVLGTMTPAGRRSAGLRWLNSLPAGQARRRLSEAGVTAELTEELVAGRPLPDDWVAGLRTFSNPREIAPPDTEVLTALLDGPPDGPLANR